MTATEYRLVNADCLEWLARCPAPAVGEKYATIFADPPDNIGLGYDGYEDNMSSEDYADKLREWLYCFIHLAGTVWFSFNSRYATIVGRIVEEIVEHNGDFSNCVSGSALRLIEEKLCVQTFAFGQHRSTDLGNNFRPVWRLRWVGAYLDPDAIRIESERQRMGDKRADPRGRVPGDVFDFPRVVGNSSQRRKWHRTQLNEGLVDRCLRLTTPAGGHVLDPFAGTGTTMRVAMRNHFNCDCIELSQTYCKEIAADNGLAAVKTIPPTWTRRLTGEIEDLPLFGGDQDQVVKR